MPGNTPPSQRTIRVTDLEISAKTMGLLQQAGLVTFEDLRTKWPEGIAALPGMTSKAKREIAEVVSWVDANIPRDDAPEDPRDAELVRLRAKNEQLQTALRGTVGLIILKLMAQGYSEEEWEAVPVIKAARAALAPPEKE